MSDVENKIRTLIGFARKAGKLAIGKTAVETAYHRNKLQLIILTEDASERHLRFLERDIENVRAFRFGTKDMMGQLLGRSEAAILGITDANFARSLCKFLSKEIPTGKRIEERKPKPETGDELPRPHHADAQPKRRLGKQMKVIPDRQGIQNDRRQRRQPRFSEPPKIKRQQRGH